MKILKIILAVIAIIVVLFLLVAAFAPKTFHVERKLVIKAPAEDIFAELNSLKKWEQWSPWIREDTTTKISYSGPEQGPGNKASWTMKSGKGSQEIKESVSPKFVRTELAFDRVTPFEGLYTLTPKDSGVEVTWASSGSMGYPWNIFTLFMDKMEGHDFEKALANLKEHVENAPKWKLGEYKIEELESMHILSIIDSCPVTEISKKLGSLYGEIGALAMKNKVTEQELVSKPVMAYYHSYSPEKVVLEAAFQVSKEMKSEGRVKARTTEKMKVLAVTFHGDYSYLHEGIQVIMDYVRENHLERNGPELELYMTDPTTVKSKMDIVTQLYFPIK